MKNECRADWRGEGEEEIESEIEKEVEIRRTREECQSERERKREDGGGERLGEGVRESKRAMEAKKGRDEEHE